MITRRIFATAMALIVALAALFAGLPPAAAQSAWAQRATEKFTILYAPGSEADAEVYAGFVDQVYEDLATLFSFRAATPLTLRLYPTAEPYYTDNPAARQVAGVIAHADFRHRELVVIVERTRNQSAEGVQNNVRHELTHIIAAELSANRLNTGFQEGIAQYLEQRSDELDVKVQSLRAARESATLLPWAAFDDRDAIYGSPAIGYPQTLSVVAYLVERAGFGTLRDFLNVSAHSAGFASALERAYGVPVTMLEREWRDWLPGYLDGGYKRNPLVAYDLAFARDLVAQGRYGEAENELSQALEWLRANAATQPAATIAEAEALLATTKEGRRAQDMAEAARTAINATDYERARQLIAQARDIYRQIGDTRHDAVLAEYAARVARGEEANRQLLRAFELMRAFNYPAARAAADAAASDFALLGDQAKLDHAIGLRRALDTRQRFAGALLIALGLVGVVAALFGRSRRPVEVW